MNRKIFIGLFVISLLVLSGGCGGSSHSVTGSTNVNAALSGAWTASSGGTASITGIDSDDFSDIDALIGPFDELSSDVLENIANLIKSFDETTGTVNVKEKYEEEKKKGIAETVNVPVTSAMAVFEDCNISGDSGTAKLTAIVILSKDDSFMPVVFNGVTLSTQRSGNELTATVPDGTLTMNMASDEKMTFSGKIKYLSCVCEFSTVMNKNPSNSIDPNTILNGTWNLSGDQSGGYLSDGSQIIAAAAPETASIFFSGTDSQPSVTSLYSLRMRTSSTESHDETSLLQNISDGKGTLTDMGGSVYKFTEADGTESVIFVENIDEIFVFMLESEDNYESCMFLPLKKVSVDIEKALKETTWKAAEGMGGGYASNFDDETLKKYGAFSFFVKEAELNFSDVTLNNDTVTATVEIDSEFTFANEKLGIEANNISIPIKGSQKVTMTRSGNFLQFTHDKDVYKISFVSDKEAFLSITPDSNSATGELVIRFSAN